MRPLRIEIAGFGAYADRQELDFAELGRNALFLVHGPTGAGKTTILDAICFALYGETSGGERDGRQMRSQHAEPQAPTEVVLDFALGEERAYRVRRNPDYERPARRGGGVTQERHAATLWRLERDGAGSPWAEGRVLATKASAVSEEVGSLLGLDAQQFRQVVILPQGQFRQLLSAKSDEREKILKVLFGTERLAGLQELMKARAAEIGREVLDHRRREADLLAQAGAESLDALDQRLAGLRAEGVALAGERLLALRGAAQGARAAREAGQAARARLSELAEAEAALARLDAREPELAVTRDRCERARRGARLAGERARLEEAELRLGRAEGSLAASGRELAVAGSEAEAADERLGAERAGEPEREAARRQAERLAALEPDLAEAYRAKGEASRLADGSASAAAALARAVAELEAAAGARSRAEALLEQARAAAASLPGFEAEARERRRLGDERRQLALEEGEAREQDRALATLRARQDETVSRAERIRGDIEQLERLFRSGSASALAAGLSAGEPCPVCGSREHPSPATAAELPKDGQATIQTARDLLANVERDARAQAEGLTRAQAVRAGLAQRIALRRQALGELAGRPVGEAEAAEAGAQAALQAARAKAERLGEAKAAFQSARERAERLSAARESAAGEAQRLAAEADAAATAAARALERVPASLRQAPDGAAAERQRRAALAAAQGRHEALERALREAEGRARAASAGLGAARAGHAARAQEAQHARAKRDEAAAALDAAVVAAGFPDLAAYHTALLEPAELEGLEARLAAAGEARRSALDRQARARSAAEGAVPPDLEALLAAEAGAEAALGEASRDLGAHAKQLEQLDALRRQAAELAPRREALEARYGVLGRLADVAGGTAGGFKVTFQRFVLGAFLDEVLDAASHRLRAMSQGRYVLRRLDPDVSGGSRKLAAGLDLEVDDAWTGRTRHVATLSGGEGFLAALALALGLADVVQTRSGGRRLDTLFVDEGFGALDAEALDEALKVLTELQRDGRLVGLISHVPELRERIDVRLEVVKGERGSRARFRLP